jgi:hypothetical protein
LDSNPAGYLGDRKEECMYIGIGTILAIILIIVIVALVL